MTSKSSLVLPALAAVALLSPAPAAADRLDQAGGASGEAGAATIQLAGNHGGNGGGRDNANSRSRGETEGRGRSHERGNQPAARGEETDGSARGPGPEAPAHARAAYNRAMDNRAEAVQNAYRGLAIADALGTDALENFDAAMTRAMVESGWEGFDEDAEAAPGLEPATEGGDEAEDADDDDTEDDTEDDSDDDDETEDVADTADDTDDDDSDTE